MTVLAASGIGSHIVAGIPRLSNRVWGFHVFVVKPWAEGTAIWLPPGMENCEACETIVGSHSHPRFVDCPVVYYPLKINYANPRIAMTKCR
jgi:hypothetical protein